MKIELSVKKEFDVKYLNAKCDVRYWDDSKINGVPDSNGDLTPLRDGENWDITIDVERGKINDWPEGVKADVHFKVCDAGVYTLLDSDSNKITEVDGYVVDMMSPGGKGYGDYVIMTIDENGIIENFEADFSDFSR